MEHVQVRVHQLLRLLAATTPHQGNPDLGYPKALAGTRFDSDGHRLYVVATDRHTIAATRADLHKPDAQTWAHTIAARMVDALNHWLQGLDEDRLVTIFPVGDDKPTVTFCSGSAMLSTPTLPGTFPNWRSLFAKTLASPVAGTVAAINTEMNSRWADAATYCTTWQSGEKSPVVFAADDFIGLQMPAWWPPSESRSPLDTGAIDTWKEALSGAQPADARTVLGDPTDTKPTRAFTAYLLRRVTLAARDGLRRPIDDPTFYDVVDSLNASWIAYRLLETLRAVAPTAALEALRDLHEELEGGEFAEIAWDYAQQAGHDPQQWIREHEEIVKKRAANAAARAAQKAQTTEQGDEDDRG